MVSFVPVEHDPWDISPPVPQIELSQGLGVKPIDQLIGGFTRTVPVDYDPFYNYQVPNDASIP